MGVNELPHRPVIDLEPALGELGDQPAQRKGIRASPRDQPIAMRAGDLGRHMTAELAGSNAAGVPQPERPLHHARRRDAQRRRNRSHTLTRRDPRHRTLPQIHR